MNMASMAVSVVRFSALFVRKRNRASEFCLIWSHSRSYLLYGRQRWKRGTRDVLTEKLLPLAVMGAYPEGYLEYASPLHEHGRDFWVILTQK